MDIHPAAEALRQFVLEHGLPRTDTALVGISCPYCGKSDRIRPLEHPRDILNSLSRDERSCYSTLFDRLATDSETLGVCKFCQNPVRLVEGVRPEPLEKRS